MLFCQFFVQYFLPELVNICNSPRGTSTWVPIWQQGFVPGRRIYAAYLSLYSLIEKSRLSNYRLSVCFVDVKRAFPSVRREILLKKYAEDGMNDSLIRVIWAIYKGATATIRGKHGYGRLFEILLGTREGGSEGPLLFLFFSRSH